MHALAVAFTSRLVLFLIVWFTLRVTPRFDLYPVQLPDTFFPDRLWLDGWARWDAAHYVAIAGQGYGGDNPSPHGGVGFFPLFPLLMRGAVESIGADPTPGNLALAGILIANLCFLASVPLLARLAAQHEGGPSRTVPPASGAAPRPGGHCSPPLRAGARARGTAGTSNDASSDAGAFRSQPWRGFLASAPGFNPATAGNVSDGTLNTGFGQTAALLLCVAPFGFFFNAAYSESLFLVLVLGAFTVAGTGRWWWAAAIAGLASGARLVGLALMPALLFWAWRRRAPLRELIGIAIFSPLGTLIYGLYTWWRFDDPLAYFNAQATWGGWDEHVRFYAELFLLHPREALLGDPRHLIIVLNTLLGVLALALLPKVWQVCDEGVALFTTLLVVVQFAFTWVSLGRYLLPAVGLYLAGAALLTEPRSGWSGWARDAVVVGSALLLAMLTGLYARAFWVV